MIALFILSLMGGAIISLTLQILAVNNSAKLRTQKVFLAQQLLEQVRNFYQSNNWFTLSQKSGCWSDGNLNSGVTCGLACPAAGQELKVVNNPPQVTITALVTWQDRDQCRQISETTYYYNY